MAAVQRLARGLSRRAGGISGRHGLVLAHRRNRLDFTQLWHMLISAHYFLGDIREALAAVGRFRETIAEELGLAIPASTEALHRAILNYDDAQIRSILVSRRRDT